MVIKGIAKGDKDLRHFTFDDGDYVVRGGIYYYKVNYGKNKLEGEYGEDEISYVECSKVIPLGGRKPKPIPELAAKNEPIYQPVEEPGSQEVKKRGRPAKVTKVEPSKETIPVGTPGTFEYLVQQFDINNLDELSLHLNSLGTQGWELCGFNPSKNLFGNVHMIAIFKRKRG